MNSTHLKSAYNELAYANQTLSLISNGEISSDKYGKTLETIIRQVTKAQNQILKADDSNATVENTLISERKRQIENHCIKIEALFNAAISLSEEDEEALQLDIFNLITDIITEKLKPAIFD